MFISKKNLVLSTDRKFGARYTHGFNPLLKEYWRNTKGFRYLFVLIMAGMVVDAVLQASVVSFVKVVIDKLIADPAEFASNHLATFVLYGCLGALLFLPFAYMGHRGAQLLSAKLTNRYRLSLYSHLQKMNSDFYQKHQVGEISSRLTGDVDAGITTLSGYFISITWSATMVLVAFTSMFLLSWKLFLVFLAMNLSYTVISRKFIKRIHVLSREVREQTGRLQARVTEDVSSNLLVKSFAVEEAFFDRFRKTQHNLYETQVKAGQVATMYQDIMQTLFHFIAPVVIIGVGSLLIGETLTVGALVAFWAYWKIVHGPISTLFNSMATLYNALASMDRVMEFFSLHPLVRDMPKARLLKVRSGEVEFRSLAFSYPTLNTKPVLRDISLTIPARTSLGIVGQSGAGKSTLIQLLLRFYDPCSGSILIDGQDIKEMRQHSLRNQIGAVLQDTILLSGSIRDNLLLVRESASDEEIWDALEMAGAKEFVSELENGLDAPLGERGANLSGGQRQRLAIARVFLKNPPIVIFDEATSALDTLTEFKIQESIYQLLTGRTSIVIAHRLSTIMRCDSILLMDQGKALDLGTHKELLSRSDLYNSLVQKQNLAVA